MAVVDIHGQDIPFFEILHPIEHPLKTSLSTVKHVFDDQADYGDETKEGHKGDRPEVVPGGRHEDRLQSLRARAPFVRQRLERLQ